MSSRFLSLILLAASMVSLNACAYLVDDAIQDITLETPGAEDALCNMYVDKLRYRVKPPQTVNITKSKKDLIIDCFAPGNRHQKVIIKAEIQKSTGYNVINGVIPGTAWDYASGAMFKYPTLVQIDFTNAPILPEKMPDQNNPDIKQPEDYKLEEFRASTPRLNSDSAGGLSTPLKRRQSTATDVSTFTDAPAAVPSGRVSDKGDLKPATVIQAPTAPSTAEPVPLYPGQ